MKKMFFVYNPNAGKGAIKPHLSDILEKFSKAGYEIRILPTKKAKEATRAVAELKDSVDMICCSGGDGTLNEVVNGLMQREDKDITIGYIPAGTTNDFARSLNISLDMLWAAERILYGKSFACDIGRFNDRYFTYVAAFGLFTDVSYDTDQMLKNMLGHTAYVIEALKKLADIKSYHMRITFDGHTIDDNFVIGLISSCKSIGGFKSPALDSSMDDGYFEITLIKESQMGMSLQDLITNLAAGDVSINNSEQIITRKASYLKIESFDKVAWSIDGEYGGNPSIVEIENLNKAIRIMT